MIKYQNSQKALILMISGICLLLIILTAAVIGYPKIITYAMAAICTAAAISLIIFLSRMIIFRIQRRKDGNDTYRR